MPIDMLGAFFPPPTRLQPDRPHRIDKSDKDGRPGGQSEPRRKRRRPAPDDERGGDDEHRISVQA